MNKHIDLISSGNPSAIDKLYFSIPDNEKTCELTEIAIKRCRPLYVAKLYHGIPKNVINDKINRLASDKIEAALEVVEPVSLPYFWESIPEILKNIDVKRAAHVRVSVVLATLDGAIEYENLGDLQRLLSQLRSEDLGGDDPGWESRWNR